MVLNVFKTLFFLVLVGHCSLLGAEETQLRAAFEALADADGVIAEVSREDALRKLVDASSRPKKGMAISLDAMEYDGKYAIQKDIPLTGFNENGRYVEGRLASFKGPALFMEMLHLALLSEGYTVNRFLPVEGKHMRSGTTIRVENVRPKVEPPSDIRLAGTLKTAAERKGRLSSAVLFTPVYLINVINPLYWKMLEISDQSIGQDFGDFATNTFEVLSLSLDLEVEHAGRKTRKNYHGRREQFLEGSARVPARVQEKKMFSETIRKIVDDLASLSKPAGQ